MIHSLNLNIDQIPRESFGLHIHAGRFTTKWHSHSDRHQLLYPEGGVLYLRTKQSQFLLPARHGAWIPAKCIHKIDSNSPDLYLHMIYLDQRNDDEDFLKKLQVFSINNLAKEMILYTQNWSIETKMDRLEKQFLQTIRLLMKDWCNHSIPLILPTTENELLKKVTNHIQSHLEEPLLLESVAKQYGFSGRTLLRLFKNELGMTFGTYKRVARIIQATELLSHPGTSVTEVAYTVGYESLSSFSQCFQQLVGMLPHAYLKEGTKKSFNSIEH